MRRIHLAAVVVILVVGVLTPPTIDAESASAPRPISSAPEGPGAAISTEVLKWERVLKQCHRLRRDAIEAMLPVGINGRFLGMQSPDYVKLKLTPNHQALVAQLTRLEVEHNLLEGGPLLNLLDKVSRKEQGGGADAEGNQDTPREIDKKDQLRVDALSMAENEAEKVFILRQWRREQNLKNETSECVKTCQKLLVHSKFNSALRAAQVQSLTTGAGQSLSSYKEHGVPSYKEPVEALENDPHAQFEPSSKEARYLEATSRVTDPLLRKLLRKRKDTPNEERSHANEDDVIVANIPSAQDVELAERRAVSSQSWQKRVSHMLFGSARIGGGLRDLLSGTEESGDSGFAEEGEEEGEEEGDWF